MSSNGDDIKQVGSHASEEHTMWTLTVCEDPTHDEPRVVGTYDTLAEARAASLEPLTYQEGLGRWSSREGTYVALHHTRTDDDAR